MNGSTALFWDQAAFFTFVILHTVGKTPWTGDQPCRRADTYTQDGTNTE
jgi:hypothetical protein